MTHTLANLTTNESTAVYTVTLTLSLCRRRLERKERDSEEGLVSVLEMQLSEEL